MKTLDDITKLISESAAAQQPKEMHWFYERAEKISPHIIAEIGVYYGGTHRILGTLLKEESDILIGIDGEKKEFIKWDPDKEKYTSNYIIGNSHDDKTKERAEESLSGREIDILFIDGDHSGRGVKKDYEMYSPLVRSGGIIAFHDISMHDFNADGTIHDGGVMEFWNSLPGKKYEFFSIPRELRLYGIGYIIKQSEENNK